MVQLLAETVDAESQAVKCFFMNSPWTVVFCAELRGLLYPEWVPTESGLYRDVTRQVMGDIGMLLLQVVRQPYLSSEDSVPSILAFRQQWTERFQARSEWDTLEIIRTSAYVI